MNIEAERREALMTKIRNYWVDQGYLVKVWSQFVPPRSADGMQALGSYEIRSDLINGLPLRDRALFREAAE